MCQLIVTFAIVLFCLYVRLLYVIKYYLLTFVQTFIKLGAVVYELSS